ncbi:MAG TPA: Uma2 family endonuclease [Labilithrix sp.]|nr:Uma2 family endonuclease [Labilithrix sp.]
MSSSTREVGVRYTVPRLRAGWELSEETMPESVVHDEAVELLKALLLAFAARAGNMQVVRNLAVRWDAEHPQIGVDPDVSVLSPPPPNRAELRSVRTWLEGHSAPIVAVEVVSETNPHKDYVVAPDKYAASGVGELWIFDPMLAGPTSHGGPFRLQVWHREGDGDLIRIYAGDGPAPSPTLNAYLVVVHEGRKLRIADDADATRFWMTGEESERAAKDAALARIAELEAKLAQRGQ